MPLQLSNLGEIGFLHRGHVRIDKISHQKYIHIVIIRRVSTNTLYYLVVRVCQGNYAADMRW